MKQNNGGKNWVPAEDAMLLHLWGELHDIRKISALFPDRSADSVRARLQRRYRILAIPRVRPKRVEKKPPEKSPRVLTELDEPVGIAGENLVRAKLREANDKFIALLRASGATETPDSRPGTGNPRPIGPAFVARGNSSADW